MYYKVFLTFNKHTNEIVSFINTKFNINNNLTYLNFTTFVKFKSFPMNSLGFSGFNS